MDLKAGIDLGTTNSCIYVVIDDEIVLVKDKYGNATVPSAVWKQKGVVKIGRPARAYAGKSPGPVLEVKRLMGTDKTVTLDGESVSPVQVSAMILRHLKEAAEAYVRTNHPDHAGSITDVVITHPAYFPAAAKAATSTAAEQAGFRTVVLLPEPTAAAIAYSKRLAAGGADAGDRRILAYDLGGGTFDVTVLERKAAEGRIDVLEYGGDPWLGGANFDLCLADHLRDQLIARKYRLADLDPAKADDAVRIARLKHEAEGIKIDLTGHDPVQRAVPNFMEDLDGEVVDLEVAISRDEFNGWTKALMDRSIELTDKTLAKQSFADGRRLTAEEVDALPAEAVRARARANAQHCDVIMVGSSCWMPVVKERLEDELGRPCQLVSPDVIVAEGAAIKAMTLVQQDQALATSDDRMTVSLAYPAITNRARLVPVKGEVHGQPIPCAVILTDVETGQQEQRILEAKRTFLFSRNLRSGAVNEFTLRVQRRDDDHDVLEHAFSVTHDPASHAGDPGKETLAIAILVETRRGFETLFAENSEFPINGEIALRTPDDSGTFRVPFYEGDSYVAEMLIDKAPKQQGVPFKVRAVMDAKYNVSAEVLLEDQSGKAPTIDFSVKRARRVRTIDEILDEIDRLRGFFRERLEGTTDATRRTRLRARRERIETDIQQELSALTPESSRLEDLAAQYQKLVAESGMAPQLTPRYEDLVEEMDERRTYAPGQDDVSTLKSLLDDARRAWDVQNPDTYHPAVQACRELTKGWKPKPPPPSSGGGQPEPNDIKRRDLEGLEEIQSAVSQWPDSRAAERDELLTDVAAAISRMQAAPDNAVIQVHNNVVVPLHNRFAKPQPKQTSDRPGPKPPDPI